MEAISGKYMNKADLLDAFGHGTTYNSKEIQEIINNLSDAPISIYAIMTCTKLEEEVYPTGKRSGFPDYGTSKTAGYFTSLDDAKTALLHNSTDLWETCYDYACIEKVEEGLECPGELVGWYKYDREKNGYSPIETPSFDKHICGRTIG